MNTMKERVSRKDFRLLPSSVDTHLAWKSPRSSSLHTVSNAVLIFHLLCAQQYSLSLFMSWWLQFGVVFIAAETMQQICNTKDGVLLLNVSMGKLLSATLVVLHMWMWSTCIPLQKHLGYCNHIFRLSELHQCDQEMLLGRFSWKFIEELFL